MHHVCSNPSPPRIIFYCRTVEPSGTFHFLYPSFGLLQCLHVLMLMCKKYRTTSFLSLFFLVFLAVWSDWICFPYMSSFSAFSWTYLMTLPSYIQFFRTKRIRNVYIQAYQGLNFPNQYDCTSLLSTRNPSPSRVIKRLSIWAILPHDRRLCRKLEKKVPVIRYCGSLTQLKMSSPR